MEIKKFIIGNTERTFRCYTSCPDEAGIELYTIINSALEQLNKLLDNTYSAYKNHFPQVTRPILYVYLREDDVANINAFTDGKDIYLSVAAMIGMDSYIRERLNTQKFNGEDLVPDDLRTTTQLRIYNYILELIVAHELTHIWHCHKLWKSAVLRTRGATASHIEDEILSEMVCLEKNYSEQYEDGTLTDIEAFSIDRGHIICESVADKNFIQQILEIDADCCAMCIVIANLQKEMEPIAIAYNSDPEKSKNKIRAIISCHSYLLGLIAGAAGLMCGFFDSQRTGATFERLSYLLSSDHPIPAVRFFKMNVTLNEMIYTIYEDNDIAEMLLSSTDAFSVDIFMHKDHVMDLKNCFWAPVQTREAQEFITLLEKGWNLIHDSLQSFALLEIPSKFSAEDLLIPDRLVWFDKDGNTIRKS